jgi:ABC-type Fe3+/spermidine/putrescine transport system ATPase subunit
MTEPDVQVELRGVHKRYGAATVLKGVDFAVRKGEFFALLGPSGCGKSTILRMIGGFEDPSEGDILIGGRNMRGVAPERRQIGIVFQNYALFPHMTAADNIAFGLQARARPARDITARVDAMLKLVGLEGLGKRRPAELSGGQQQRVALARALVIEPLLLLLDEPFGALDRKLREGMQRRVVEIQRQLDVTTIFVTHDQDEALTMSDRLAVLSTERLGIAQIGTPRQIYDRPVSQQVSSFIGRTNSWSDEVVTVLQDGMALTRRGFQGRAPIGVTPRGTVTVSLRPERVRISDGSPLTGTDNAVDGILRDIVFGGEMYTYIVETAVGVVIAIREANDGWRPPRLVGARVTLCWSSESMLLLDQRFCQFSRR